MVLRICAYVFLITAMSACTAKKYINVSQNKVTVKDIVAVWGSWIKEKGPKYDVNFHISNISEKFFIIMLHDLRCFKGDRPGTLMHTFFNTGERTIDFLPNETKSFKFVCRIGSQSTGKYKISIMRIYENPNRDGKQLGKIIAKDIDWVINENHFLK